MLNEAADRGERWPQLLGDRMMDAADEAVAEAVDRADGEFEEPDPDVLASRERRDARLLAEQLPDLEEIATEVGR